MIAYYDGEAETRARRHLPPERIAARGRFIESVGSLGLPVLEVGTGTGRDIAGLTSAGLRIVGIDLSLEQAVHSRAAGSQQVVGSVRKLPFAPKSFGALWTMSVLMHVPNSVIMDALDEIRRVLVPGATAAIGVWGGNDTEQLSAMDPHPNPRFFSLRSDNKWKSLIGRLGTICEYETWNREEHIWYQWALVRLD